MVFLGPFVLRLKQDSKLGRRSVRCFIAPINVLKERKNLESDPEEYLFAKLVINCLNDVPYSCFGVLRNTVARTSFRFL